MFGVDDAVNAGLGIANTITNIADKAKVRDMNYNISMLTQSQQLDLQKKMAAQSSDDARMSVLVTQMAEYQKQNSINKQKKQTSQLIIISAVGVVTLGLVIYALKN